MSKKEKKLHAHDHAEAHEHEEHEHEHECGCGCGHDHDHEGHEHGECHCHDHEHEHEHEHEHGCGCGHDHDHDHERHDLDHEHEHGHGCGCGGHDHEHEHGHDHGHDHDHGGCGCGCCDCEEEEPAHDHHDDPEMAQYAQEEENVMRSHEEIEVEERKAFGHFHHEGEEDDCDLCGKELHGCRCEFAEDGKIRSHFRLEHLDCRECAAKMEGKLKGLAALDFVAISFQDKELHLISKMKPQQLLPQLLKIIHSVDEGVGIMPEEDSGSYKTQSYLMPSLDCPACAVKLEKVINAQPGVLSATVSYATKQLKLTAEDPDSLIDELVRVCNTVENGTVIEKKTAGKKQPAAHEEEGSALDKILLPLGILLFIIGMAMHHEWFPVPSLFHYQEEAVFGIAYLIFGGEILWKAGKNILHGEIFDENFLMSIATLGAIGINEMSEAVGVMMFYRIGEFMEDRASDQSRDQIMAAVDLRPEVICRVKGEGTETVPAEEGQVGDILLIRPGDRIPLDGIITEGDSQIDTSAVTGEPKPVQVHVGDSVSSGCVNQTGTIKIRVEKVLAESMVSRILDSVENAVANKPKIDRFITRFSRIYTPLVVGFAILVAVVPPLSFDAGNWDHWIYTALTFLVISCPCALVISVPLAFFAGIGAGSKQGILFKGGTSLESAAHTKVVVMDKTGTITEGKFKVREIRKLADMSEEEMLALAAGAEAYSTHPIARSIVDAAEEKKLTAPAIAGIHEQAGEGVIGEIAGEKFGLGNHRLMARFGVTLPEAADDDFAGTEIWLAKEGKLLGSIRISDDIKVDAIQAISELKKQGITPAMLTGDAPKAAAVIGKKVGIEDILAGLLPEDKLSEMNKIRAEKGSVLYVGDGINDAPVLAGADTGAAMGSGADAAIEAADLVFLHSQVASIPMSIKIAKAVLSTATFNVIFALAVKVAVMVMGLAGFANMWVAVFADVGVTIICILYSMHLLAKKF